MFKQVFIISLFLVSLGASISCTEEIANAITCADVCNRYEECIDEDYDVAECTDQCENEASSDEDKEDRLEACDACLDDTSCAEAVLECTTDCVGVIEL